MFNIPDNYYRIFIALGIILMGYSYIQFSREIDDYNKNVDSYRNEEVLINEKIGVLNVKLKEFENIANQVSISNNISNPIKVKDTMLIFKSVYSENFKKNRIIDTIYNSFMAYKIESGLIEVQKRKLDKLEQYLDEHHDNLNESKKTYLALGILGLLFFLFGINGLANSYHMENRLKYTEINGQRKFYERCQSCATKFSSMITYGRNRDGTYNSAFCKSCFDDGGFIEPQITKREIIERITTSRKKASWAEKIVANLDRWKKNSYD